METASKNSERIRQIQDKAKELTDTIDFLKTSEATTATVNRATLLEYLLLARQYCRLRIIEEFSKTNGDNAHDPEA